MLWCWLMLQILLWWSKPHDLGRENFAAFILYALFFLVLRFQSIIERSQLLLSASPPQPLIRYLLQIAYSLLQIVKGIPKQPSLTNGIKSFHWHLEDLVARSRAGHKAADRPVNKPEFLGEVYIGLPAHCPTTCRCHQNHAGHRQWITLIPFFLHSQATGLHCHIWGKGYEKHPIFKEKKLGGGET